MTAGSGTDVASAARDPFSGSLRLRSRATNRQPAGTVRTLSPSCAVALACPGRGGTRDSIRPRSRARH
jgi:hypothetical protein